MIPPPSREALIEDLARLGVKFTLDNIVAIRRDATGRILFLEKGNSRAGLEHIVLQHGDDFAKRGIAVEKIPDAVLKAAADGVQVAIQGTRPVYEVEFDGRTHLIAVTVGTNGFIVGANPATR
jgi:hypothetical protein